MHASQLTHLLKPIDLFFYTSTNTTWSYKAAVDKSWHLVGHVS